MIARLSDASAVALVTADGFRRRGQVVPMLDTGEGRRSGGLGAHDDRGAPHPLDLATGDRRVPWPGPPGFPTEQVERAPAAHRLHDGDHRRPKGLVHVHGGLTVKLAEEGAFQLDVHPEDTCSGSPTWAGSWGPGGWWDLANGGTLALFEGAPDHPGPDRLWAFLARHRVCIVGLSPTLVRSLMPHGTEPVLGQDTSSAIRVLGSTGEPWNEAPWHWYFKNVGGGRCPVINISSGFRGGCLLPLPPRRAAHQADVPGRTGPGHSRRRVRRRRASRYAARWASWCAPARGPA